MNIEEIVKLQKETFESFFKTGFKDVMNPTDVFEKQKEAFQSLYKTDLKEAMNPFKLVENMDLFDTEKYKEILSNNIKFHSAMIAYNNAIKDMYEVVSDNKKILLKK